MAASSESAFFVGADGQAITLPDTLAQNLNDLRKAIFSLSGSSALELELHENGSYLRVSLAALKKATAHASSDFSHPGEKPAKGDEMIENTMVQAFLVKAERLGAITLLLARHVVKQTSLHVVDDHGCRGELLAMGGLNRENQRRFIQCLDKIRPSLNVPKDLVGAALIPLLSHGDVMGLAGRVLGRYQVKQAVEPIKEALSRAQTLDERLMLLTGLLHLGCRELVFRTLRSILIHGNPLARIRAAHAISDLLSAQDLDTCGGILKLTPTAVKMRVAAALYCAGELGTYQFIKARIEALTQDSERDEINDVLEAVQRIGSTRFTCFVNAYASRETRPWYRHQAGRVAEKLAREGARESSVNILISKATLAYWREEPEEVMANVAVVLALDPSESEALYLRANCLKDLGFLEDALSDVCSALCFTPDNWRLYRLRGSILWDLGNGLGALEAYQQALARCPDDPSTWFYKGYILFRMGRYLEALPCYRRARTLMPAAPRLLHQEGFCLEKLGRYHDAAACYRRSLKITPHNHTTLQYLGDALHKSGDFVSAMACYETLLELRPEGADALYCKADTLYDLGRFMESAATFEHFLRTRPDSYPGW